MCCGMMGAFCFVVMSCSIPKKVRDEHLEAGIYEGSEGMLPVP